MVVLVILRWYFHGWYTKFSFCTCSLSKTCSLGRAYLFCCFSFPQTSTFRWWSRRFLAKTKSGAYLQLKNATGNRCPLKIWLIHLFRGVSGKNEWRSSKYSQRFSVQNWGIISQVRKFPCFLLLLLWWRQGNVTLKNKFVFVYILQAKRLIIMEKWFSGTRSSIFR